VKKSRRQRKAGAGTRIISAIAHGCDAIDIAVARSFPELIRRIELL
jgi:hypothetical protein